MWEFQRFTVWSESRGLVRAIYDVTDSFPDDERFGLTSQLGRVANSIGANIAEACGRPGGRDRANLLAYALGSANEVEHHLIVATDLKLIDPAVATALRRRVDGIRRMLSALRGRSIEAS